MERFATLYDAIDRTTSTNAKVAAMVRYFQTAPPADAAWAVFFLTGRRLKRLVPSAAIRAWTLAATGLDAWLLDECYAVVGDGAETAALVLDQVAVASTTDDTPLSEWVQDRILPLRQLDPAAQQVLVSSWWSGLDRLQRFMLLKILTGELRVGVSQTLVVRALAQAAGLPPAIIAARLMGEWAPGDAWFSALLSHEHTDDDRSRPYPFFLAAPLEEPAEALGPPTEWMVEWKWDGIRAQLVRRRDAIHLWSRGEELITHRFPEIAAAATRLPDGTVLDGEVLAYRNERPLPFSALQQRIGRQKQVAQMVRAVPVVFMAYDVLENEGIDIRTQPLESRRSILESHLSGDRGVLRLSTVVSAASWDELAAMRANSRSLGVEGFMLKRRSSPYGVGRRRGDWWKWKIDPYTIDAVLIYAQPGSGRRASLLTDYTFGVWDAGELVPVAKAYSGLSNEEIGEMDRWIRRHTRERFGPVRHVEPVQVFELGFEAIARSTRHRSGIAVRFPRMLRWRKDKKPEEADSLDTVRQLLTGA